MARWEPDARGRLLRAAVALFAERGYEATTAAQIAERAGLTKTTLFRHFADKREILFQGQDDLVALAVGGVQGAPSGSTPSRCCARASSPCARCTRPSSWPTSAASTRSCRRAPS